MMTKLREMSVIFLWILVFAFLGLMVFEWGMDYTGLRSRRDVLGKIDGQKITIEEFNKALQQAYLAEKERTGQEPDEQRMKQLRDQVWESFIQRILFQKEIEKHNIKVSDREIALQLLNNPPLELRQNPNFQTDGQFDIQKYQEALRNPNIDWRPVEEYLRQTLPYQKLQKLIVQSVVVTEEEIKDEYMRQNMKAKIDYLYIPISNFAKEPVEVSEEEIKKYYEDHKEDFKIEEKRKLNYVLFSTAPSSEDSAKVYRLAEDLIRDARQGADFNKLADEYSEDPSVSSNHGDLGYFEKEAMVPEFSEAAFGAKPGEIVGPVKTRFGLHIIKVIDKKVENGKEKVRAAHILLKFRPGALTIEDASNAANNFRELAEEEGFKVAADQLKLEVKQTPAFTQQNFIPGFGVMESAVRWAFNAKLNDVSDVYRTEQGYVVFQVAEIQPAGYRPYEEVKSICKNRVEFEKHKEMARQYALTFRDRVKSGEDFKQIADTDTAKKVMYGVTKEFKKDIFIPELGRAPQVVAAAFTLPLNTPSDMLETERGFYYIRVLERTEFDENAYMAARDQIRQRLLQQKQQQFFNKWYEQLKERAEIEDNRDLFFQG